MPDPTPRIFSSEPSFPVVRLAIILFILLCLGGGILYLTLTSAPTSNAKNNRPPLNTAPATTPAETKDAPVAGPQPLPIPLVPVTQPTPPLDNDLVNEDELLPTANPDRDFVVGRWKMNGKNLTSSVATYSRMAFRYMPPPEYDYRVDFTRTQQLGPVVLVFPVKGKSAVLYIDNAKHGYHFGAATPNVEVVHGDALTNNVPHTAVVEVRNDTVKAFVDGQLILTADLNAVSIESPADWRLPDQNMPGVGASTCGVSFHRVSISSVGGKGLFMPEDTDAANAVSPEYWKGARNVMPATLDSKPDYGNWTAQIGKLSVARTKPNEPAARLSLYYQPPEEYDFKIEFTRTFGSHDIGQIIVGGGRQFAWKMDALGVTMLDMINEKYYLAGAAALKTPALLRNNVIHAAVVCVRKNSIKAFIDGRLYLSRATDFSDMSIETMWRIRTPKSLGLASTQDDIIFHKILVKEISGPGQPVEKPAAPAEAF